MGLEGQGVGHDTEGNIYFVPGAITGDHVSVTPEQTRKRYRDAQLDKVETPSPERVDPQCEHFKVCGGCDWLQWEYSAQLRAKEATLEHVLERGDLVAQTTEPIAPSPEVFGYRNRIQVRQLGDQVGFYKRGSHEIVDVKHCRVIHPLLNGAIEKLRQDPTPILRKAELFVDDRGEVGWLYDVAHGAGGFTQINPGQNENLREAVAQAVIDNGSKHVLELFCGNGNLTFAYLPHVESVYGVDSSKAAVQRARDVATERSITKTTFTVGTIETAEAKLPEEVRERCDTLILDPPRTGMTVPLETFLHDGIKTVIYVSCFPVAFAKDVQCLKQNFTFQKVQPLDMFPHTRHIEFVGVFSRS